MVKVLKTYCKFKTWTEVNHSQFLLKTYVWFLKLRCLDYKSNVLNVGNLENTN